jgi:hypothetical protein
VSALVEAMRREWVGNMGSESLKVAIAMGVSAAIVLTIWYGRFHYDKRLVYRHVMMQGGVVEQFRINWHPLRGDYMVTYRDKDGNRHFGICTTQLSRIYWSSDELIP